MILSVTNVAKTYTTAGKTVPAVGGVSLRIDGGEMVALKGPSGCGKTTMLMIAGGMCTPDSGTVEICGEQLYHRPVEEQTKLRAAKIGFVFQRFHLLPYLPVVENILAPSLAVRGGRGMTQALELAVRFGLQHRLRHLPGELSTGECQRTALARALFNEPQLILADEPTGNLDEENGATVLAALRQFTADGGAVLLVTHDSTAAARADRIIAMKEGVIFDA